MSSRDPKPIFLFCHAVAQFCTMPLNSKRTEYNGVVTNTMNNRRQFC